jgi:hypothetical protein
MARTSQEFTDVRSERMIWPVCGREHPAKQIVFFAQTLILYVVIIASVINLSCTNGDQTLWVALLSSSLGLMLPHPTFKSSTPARGAVIHERQTP